MVENMKTKALVLLITNHIKNQQILRLKLEDLKQHIQRIDFLISGFYVKRQRIHPSKRYANSWFMNENPACAFTI